MDKIPRNSDSPQNPSQTETLITDAPASSPLEQAIYPVSVAEPAIVLNTLLLNFDSTPGLGS